MKKLIAVLVLIAGFTASQAMAAWGPSVVQGGGSGSSSSSGGGSSSGGSSSSGSSSSESGGTTTSNGATVKYSVGAAEAAATDGDTNSVSWTFE